MLTRFFRRKAPKHASTGPVGQVGTPTQGRRYRQDVPYALPKDLEEGQRLNLQHYIFRYVLRSNYAVPLPEMISSILDVGSGSGIWGQEMAQLFPAARVFGLDLEPPQTVSLAAAATPVLENYHFVQGNLLKGLPFPDRMFDYTHQRMLVAAIPRQQWPETIRELIRVTRPSGWIELLEISSEIRPAGAATTRCQIWLAKALGNRGIDMALPQHLGELLAQNNLQHVSHQPVDIPLGSWDNHLGVLMEKDLLSAFQGLKPFACATENISPETFDRYLAEARAEWKHQKAFCRFYLAYGQV